MKQPTYFNDRQIADRFGVHRATVWRWVQRGEFPKPVRLTAGITRWLVTDVEAFEERQRAAA